MGTTLSIFKYFILKGVDSFGVLPAICSIIFISSSCNLTSRQRLEVLSSAQGKRINDKISLLAASDSVRVFNEVTTKKDGAILAEILYLRIYQSKLLPADNNLAEQLAKNICTLIWPMVPNGNKYTLWKLQFVTEKGSNQVQLQKIFNFLPSELVEKDANTITTPDT